MKSMQTKPPDRLLDSWIGVTDPIKRKTLQNRLNQRAHRCRQRALRAQQDRQQDGDAEINIKQERPVADIQLRKKSSSPPRSLDHLDFCYTATKSKHLTDLEALIHLEFARGSPTIDLLLGLTQLNIIRALQANRDILGYQTSDMHDDALSAFNFGLSIDSDLICESSIIKTKSDLPLSLMPTTTQYKVPHHPWLDLIPIPKMRDTLIRAGDSIDDLKLCHDICGYRVPQTGILIWKEPWDPSGWEVTERFLQLWGWVVRDCWELFESTDRWRRKRGAAPLFNLL